LGGVVKGSDEDKDDDEEEEHDDEGLPLPWDWKGNWLSRVKEGTRGEENDLCDAI